MNGSPNELTIRAIILSILLTIILTAANAYLGLKVGLTASASIPAAVISLAILHLFKDSTILESNLVQTAASSGEALVAAIAFILPALIILKTWAHFNYFQTMSIALIGGVLGVLFSIPLRRVLIFDKALTFPEGVAIGNVLKAHADGGTNVKPLLYGGLVGALIAFAQTGLKVISESFSFWTFKNKLLIGYGIGFAPALIAAGYIIGPIVGVSILLGTIVGWLIGVPFIAIFYHISITTDTTATSFYIWQHYVRFMGVGTMLVGGLWTIYKLVVPMKNAFLELRQIHLNNHTIKRTEKDLPLAMVLGSIIFVAAPLFLLLQYFVSHNALIIASHQQWILLFSAFVFVMIGGFIFAAICGYFAGLVGSTNNPVSAMALAAILMISLAIFYFLTPWVNFDIPSPQTLGAASIAVIIGALIAAISAISGDTIQDLKAGHMIGATPWKQQIMLFLGVLVAALIIPLILELLFNAYGIGGVFPREGMDTTQMLSAPQAGLMAAVTQGVFQRELPWNMIFTGTIIATIIIVIDYFLKKRALSLSVLAVGLGIYLPLSASTPVMIGAIAAYYINRRLSTKAQSQKLLLACGLVAGAAVMGVILAIPFLILGSADALRIVSDQFTPIAHVLGACSMVGLILWLGRR